MGKRANKKQAPQPESDASDEDYFEAVASQSEALSNAELKALEGQVCNLLLAAEVKKVPVKKSVIRKCILKKHGKHFGSVMTRAMHLMRHVFGYCIVSSKDGYILVNLLSSKVARYQKVSAAESSVKGLLVAILMAIFMSEEKISTDALETYLKSLDVDITTTEKPMILDFIRKKYLVMVTETSTDPPTVLYKWGERAHAEFSKKEMLDLICKIYGNMKPSQWTYQSNVIQQDLENEIV